MKDKPQFAWKGVTYPPTYPDPWSPDLIHPLPLIGKEGGLWRESYYFVGLNVSFDLLGQMATNTHNKQQTTDIMQITLPVLMFLPMLLSHLIIFISEMRNTDQRKKETH